MQRNEKSTYPEIAHYDIPKLSLVKRRCTANNRHCTENDVLKVYYPTSRKWTCTELDLTLQAGLEKT